MKLLIPVLSYESMMSAIIRSFRPGEIIRLVGVLFAPPHVKLVKEEILPAMDYFFHRSERYIDFFCVGYGPITSEPSRDDLMDVLVENSDSIAVFDHPIAGNWGFSNYAFNQVRKNFESLTNNKWHFSGDVDLILFEVEHKSSLSVLIREGFIVLDISQIISDEVVGNSRRLFERIIEFSEDHQYALHPLDGLSDSKTISSIGKGGLSALMEALPKPLKAYFDKAWKEGKHFQIVE